MPFLFHNLLALFEAIGFTLDVDNGAVVQDQLEAGKLQREVQFLRQFYARAPDEHKIAYRASQKKQLPQREPER